MGTEVSLDEVIYWYLFYDSEFKRRPHQGVHLECGADRIYRKLRMTALRNRRKPLPPSGVVWRYVEMVKSDIENLELLWRFTPTVYRVAYEIEHTENKQWTLQAIADSYGISGNTVRKILDMKSSETCGTSDEYKCIIVHRTRHDIGVIRDRIFEGASRMCAWWLKYQKASVYPSVGVFLGE